MPTARSRTRQAPTFTGTDQFTYEASDGELTSNTATVTLTVSAGTTPPVARDDTYSATEDTALTVAAPGVLGNDTDADGDTLTAVSWSPVSSHPRRERRRLLHLHAECQLQRRRLVTYRASDGAQDSNIATVTLTVGIW